MFDTKPKSTTITSNVPSGDTFPINANESMGRPPSSPTLEELIAYHTKELNEYRSMKQSIEESNSKGDLPFYTKKVDQTERTVEILKKALPNHEWATKCSCLNIEKGTFENAVGVLAPWGTIVTVDRCVLPDVLALWFDYGIPTIESCCGHGSNDGYIAVDERYQQRMIDMGFWYHEGCYTNDGRPISTLHRRDLWAWPKGRETE